MTIKDSTKSNCQKNDFKEFFINKLLFIPLLLFISFNSNAKGPFFWKAEKDGKILHILGLAHLPIPLENLQCSQKISQSLAQSNLVWTEFSHHNTEEIGPAVFEAKYGDPLRKSFQTLNEESKVFLQALYPGAKNFRRA